MTLRATMRTALQGVVTTLGETWQYRRLTSGPATATRTYGDWTEVVAHPTMRTWDQVWNAEADRWERSETQKLRVGDDLAQLLTGDQVKDPDGVVWAVQGQSSAGVGSIGYTIARLLPLQGDAGRGGGV